MPAIDGMATARKEAAFSKKTAPGPAMAITKPPKAGPTARAKLNCTAPKETA